jgi:hypothetical protein
VISYRQKWKLLVHKLFHWNDIWKRAWWGFWRQVSNERAESGVSIHLIFIQYM